EVCCNVFSCVCRVEARRRTVGAVPVYIHSQQCVDSGVVGGSFVRERQLGSGDGVRDLLRTVAQVGRPLGKERREPVDGGGRTGGGVGLEQLKRRRSGDVGVAAHHLGLQYRVLLRQE